MAYPGSQLHKLAKEKKLKLPEDEGGPGWIGYSQHSFETLPLPTEFLSAQEVVDFRDKAFQEYFTNKDYINMISKRFSPKVAQHINEMTSKKIKRSHHLN